MLRSITVLCLLLLSGSSFGQLALIWGEIPDEQLGMTTCAIDPDAAAVILADLGTCRQMDDALILVYDYHRRIKILQERAIDELGEIKIYYTHKNDRDQVLRVKAQVIHPNGQVFAIDEDNLFEEKLSKRRSRITIALPNLQVGSVIEYRYSLESKSLQIPPAWYFQHEYPTLHSQFHFRETSNLGYNFFMSPGINEKQGFFSARDIPALKEEAYIGTINDYRKKVQFQLEDYKGGRGYEFEMYPSWEYLEYVLLEAFNFGEQYREPHRVAKAYKEIKGQLEQATSDDEKIEIIYNYVNQGYRWNGIESPLAGQTIGDFIKEREGHSATFNLFIINLLRKAGITAHPVLVGGRSTGAYFKNYPMLVQFDHCIAMVESDDRTLFLDAGNPNRPLGLIHEEYLKGEGWLVDDELPSRWISVESKVESNESFLINVQLDEQGAAKGQLMVQSDGYDALRARNHYQGSSDNSLYWAGYVTDQMGNVQYANMQRQNEQNPAEKLIEKCEITIAQMANNIGDFLYVQPFPFAPYRENPLTAETRKYPVDIPYSFAQKYVMNIQIPPGYEISQLPESTQLILPNEDAKFQYAISAKRGRIQIVNEFSINKRIFSTDEYAALKELFDQQLEKINEQIVLKKL